VRSNANAFSEMPSTFEIELGGREGKETKGKNEAEGANREITNRETAMGKYSGQHPAPQNRTEV
jgi:hypothetical protein